ncbi:hypothetical protein [Prevotella sp. AGR2160]|uniref:hypothetical protein n=1 Tax=Prevotella sp. AGR2160 TaxID=1280674 RepID=UPI00041599D9|nr:hypothetical protein [Prevotella sp. AGR2160]
MNKKQYVCPELTVLRAEERYGILDNPSTGGLDSKGSSLIRNTDTQSTTESPAVGGDDAVSGGSVIPGAKEWEWE